MLGAPSVDVGAPSGDVDLITSMLIGQWHRETRLHAPTFDTAARSPQQKTMDMRQRLNRILTNFNDTLAAIQNTQAQQQEQQHDDADDFDLVSQ